MIYRDFQGLSMPLLGFGAMRLPLLPDGSGQIDEEQTAAMVRLAMENGSNYFDTAYPYHGGESERVMGRVLRAYPRDSYYLADKYPGHQISQSYDPAAIFEEQLQKCGVEYFDFYLLHNVYEKSLLTYTDPRWGIIDYFREQKRLGRIRHLGFSSHGTVDTLRQFLDLAGDDMEFCQIQLNYLDWTLQNAREKVALLNERGIPVWVMEPVRGGKLAKLPEEAEARLRAARPELSTPAWAFRWLQDIPGVTVVLSGMSNLAQMEENLQTFRETAPLSGAEAELLLSVAETLKDSVPCTACRYCCDGCPMELDIPRLLAAYNELRFAGSMNIVMSMESLPEEKRPSACIGCRSCEAICPQNILISEALADFTERLAAMPSWAEICRQRDEAAARSRANAAK